MLRAAAFDAKSCPAADRARQQSPIINFMECAGNQLSEILSVPGGIAKTGANLRFLFARDF